MRLGFCALLMLTRMCLNLRIGDGILGGPFFCKKTQHLSVWKMRNISTTSSKSPHMSYMRIVAGTSLGANLQALPHYAL